MRHWLVHFRGDLYPISVWAPTEAAARADARAFAGTRRLPAGTEVWLAPRAWH